MHARTLIAVVLLTTVLVLPSTITGCTSQESQLLSTVNDQATKIAQLEAKSEATPMPAVTSPPTISPSPASMPIKMLTHIVQEVGPSVVLVRSGESLGTGFAVFETGEVITAFHIVGSADARPTVVTPDGKEYSALIGGADQERDLALLLVPRLKVPPLPLGSSISVGESVIVVGYALGLYGEPSVTRGIVSAKRTLPKSGITLIQTDAPINQGNSGGPLLNEKGEVIGLNVLKLWDGQEAIEGLGFAVSSDEIRRAKDSLRSGAVRLLSTPTPTLRPTAMPRPQPTKVPAIEASPTIVADEGQSANYGSVVLVVRDREGRPCVGQEVELVEQRQLRKYRATLNVEGQAMVDKVVPGGYTWTRLGVPFHVVNDSDRLTPVSCYATGQSNPNVQVVAGQTATTHLEWDPRPNAVLVVRLQPSTGFPQNAKYLDVSTVGMYTRFLAITSDGTVRIDERPDRILRFGGFRTQPTLQPSIRVDFSPSTLGPLVAGEHTALVKWIP